MEAKPLAGKNFQYFFASLVIEQCKKLVLSNDILGSKSFELQINSELANFDSLNCVKYNFALVLDFVSSVFIVYVELF